MSAPAAQPTVQDTCRRAHAALRAGQAATAEAWLRVLSAKAPGEVNCLWLLGAALLAQDKIAAALETLERAVAAAPDFANARVDLARAYRRDGRAAQAREELRRVLEVTPTHHGAWLAYGDVLVELGQYADARIAFERARLTDPFRERVEAGTAAMLAQDRKQAEAIFRDILKKDAGHATALCGLAALSLAAGVAVDAERLLRHALTQVAHLPLAWRGLGPVLLDMGRLLEADAATRHLLKIEPGNPGNWIMLGAVSTRLMRQDEAIRAYEQAARLTPKEVLLQMSIGHLQKTAGRRAECIEAYKRSLEMDPGLAEAWWSLADLKNYAFSAAEVEEMQRLLASDARERSNEAQLHFALGKAFEQRREYPQAFAHYARGNALKRADGPFDIAQFEGKTARVRACFDKALFAARSGCGDPDPAPIFIVSLPRSGSTLIEQILASHSGVEGTMELPNMLTIVRELDHRHALKDGYPECVPALTGERLAALGRRYIEEVAPLRSGRAHFTDKMPNNFNHVGLIHLLLPNATVIDVRRHPMDTCFSNFKQHFAEGQSFTYDLEDLGRYYRGYLALMDHWDQVLPGKVLHVSYEALVREPEANVRRLLEHCRLPFEAACLCFHQTRRPVRTASAEQVRQPLYTSGIGQWQPFARELEPLRRALGDCLERFE